MSDAQPPVIPKHYLSNKNLLAAHAEAKAQGKLTAELAAMLRLIAERYSFHPWFRGYSFREDMVSEATVNLVRNWHKFDATKSQNPFAFFTTAIRRSYLAYLEQEREQSNIKNALIVEQGEDPSWNYQDMMRKEFDTNQRMHGSDMAFRTVEAE